MAYSKVILNGTTLMDATTATAAAADITSPKTAMLADGVMTTGTGSGGGGSSSWQLVASQEITETVTGTATVRLTDADLEFPQSEITSSTIWYVRVRDKAGKRNGYFLGSDSFFLWANTSVAPVNKLGRICISCDSNGEYVTYATSGGTVYGIEGFQVYLAGTDNHNVPYITMGGRYHATYTGTIDGTYTVELYKLKWPDNVSPFV